MIKAVRAIEGNAKYQITPQLLEANHAFDSGGGTGDALMGRSVNWCQLKLPKALNFTITIILSFRSLKTGELNRPCPGATPGNVAPPSALSRTANKSSGC